MLKKQIQCQSCGMPLNKDVKSGGSEKDGTISTVYCSSCYEDGEFKRPDITAGEMQKLVDDVLKNEMRFPKILRWLMVNQIPKLSRWKKK